MKVWIALLLALFLPLLAQANEEKEAKEGEAAAPVVAYVSLFPALSRNFGEGPKLKFFKPIFPSRDGGGY